MEGQCDTCGKTAELTAYTRPWFGDVDRTSYLCSDCLTGIRKRPNKEGERVPPPKPPRRRSDRIEKPSDWAAFREWQRSQVKEQDAPGTSLVILYDGKECIGPTRGRSSRPPSLAKIHKVMRLLAEEEKSRRRHQK